MERIARLALLIAATSVAASANSITFDTASSDPLIAQKLTLTPKSTFTPSEFEPAAMAHAFDYEKDGYIGTVHDGDVVSLESRPPTETAVPEPATVVLVGSGLLLARLKRRRS